jgi:hypothetical protein
MNRLFDSGPGCEPRPSRGIEAVCQRLLDSRGYVVIGCVGDLPVKSLVEGPYYGECFGDLDHPLYITCETTFADYREQMKTIPEWRGRQPMIWAKYYRAIIE